MNWQEALTQIESLEFDANLSVVSSTKAFFRNVAQDPVVLDLYWQIQESGELKESILDRTYDLSAQEIDMRHGNPNDKPLAVLLWLSYYAAPELGRLAATYTARAPKCWYAWKLAHQILDPAPVNSSNFKESVDAKYFTISNHSSTDSSVNLMTGGTKMQLGPNVVVGAFNRELVNTLFDKYAIGETS